MSRFGTDFAAVSAPLLIEQFGDGAADEAERVTYHPPDGSDDVTLAAIVGPLQKTVEEGTENRRIIHRRTVQVLTDATDDFGGIADPSEQGQFTIESVKYKVVKGTIKIAGGMAAMEVSRAKVTAKRRPGYVGT